MSNACADAPGRVNLIGEHTDYQEGFVMPCAVPQRTTANVTDRPGRRVRAFSVNGGFQPFEYELGREEKGGGWGDYVQGVTWVLGTQGIRLGGFDLHLRSDVPIGAGLSSSAALEIAVFRSLRTAFALDLSDVDLARLAQQSEVEFVGAPVGIMDQMASSLAREREALFLDTRTLAFERIPLPAALDLIVIDSGIAHRHAGGAYVTRRRESEEAARLLNVPVLRDCTLDDLDRLGALPVTLAKRARHIITENARVLEARDALAAGDLQRLGALFTASHRSLRDDYEVSVPAIDRLVSIAESQPDVFGARMTGGGFGGAIIAASPAGAGLRTASTIGRVYSEVSGNQPTVLLPCT